MIRVIFYVVMAFVILATIATPGLGAFALLALPFVGLVFLWRVGLAVVTRGRASEAVIETNHSRLLGPGGPDDPFAAYPLEDDERPVEAPATPRFAPAPARAGFARDATVTRPGRARPRSDAKLAFDKDV